MPESVHAVLPNTPDVALGAPETLADPWAFTQQISPRRTVRTMVVEADGQIHRNHYPRLHPITGGSPGTPWCVRLADDAGIFRLICFDFDAKGADGAELAADDCAALSRALRGLTIEHLVCESSSSGGWHVWLGVRGGAAADLVAAVGRAARLNYRSLDHGMLLNPGEGAARPPGSPHRNGSRSRLVFGSPAAFLTPSTTGEQLTGLVAVLTESAPALRPDTSVAVAVPGGTPGRETYSTHRGLTRWGEMQMATLGGGDNPSHTGFMCLLAAASSGWSFQDVQRAAGSAPGMEHYRSKNVGRGSRRPRSAPERHARLERQWGKALQRAALYRAVPAVTEPRDLVDLVALVAEAGTVLSRLRASPGRWGGTEAAASRGSVLTALTYLTVQTGRREVCASIRDLALVAGVGRTTAATALRALRADGFIVLVRPHVGADAAVWKLGRRFSTAADTLRPHQLKNTRPPADLFLHRAALIQDLEGQLTDSRHDLFTRDGLGRLAGRLYGLLRELPALTVDTAATLLGVTPGHAGTILSRLRHSKLIVKHRDGWARGRRDLRNTAARLLGVFGVLARRESRYQAERVVWAWWLAERQVMLARAKRTRILDAPATKHRFSANRPTFRAWPAYPRRTNGSANHIEARYYVDAGVLSPTNKWQLGALT